MLQTFFALSIFFGATLAQRAVAVSVDTSAQICNSYEIFNKYGSKCVSTCRNLYYPDELEVCWKETGGYLSPTCDCILDWVRNDNWECIPREKCEPHEVKCPEGQHFYDCYQDCEWTCDNIYANDIIINEEFKKRCETCKRGCFCDPHLVYDNRTNTCVERERCKECSKNEIFSDCVSYCTCNTRNSGLRCLSDCNRKGCTCEKGFIRNNNGDCVPEKECDKCGKFEWYNPNGLVCQLNCTNINNPDEVIRCNKINGGKTSAICECIKGYVRNENGECVPVGSCTPTECGQNEQISKCRRNCTCDTITQGYECYEDCSKIVCDCIEGYVRNSQGICVPIKECPVCGKYEWFNQYSSPCQYNCTTLNNQNLMDECLKQYNGVIYKACECIQGYFRNEQGICVPKEQCPTIIGVCPRGQKYYTCYNSCAWTCKNFFLPQTDEFIKECRTCKRGCFCDPSLIWDNVSQSCVEKDKCTVCPDGLTFLGNSEKCGTCLDAYNEVVGIIKPSLRKCCKCSPGLYYESLVKACLPLEICIEIYKRQVT